MGVDSKLLLRFSLLAGVGWFVLAGCYPSTTSIQRLALLAPFEGRYREVGYNALYAARLAWQDFGNPEIELLPLDDGGAPSSAADRARALARDPLVKAVIALGYDAARPEVQTALNGTPLVIVGHWQAQPVTDSTFILASPELPTLLSAPADVDVVDAARLPAPITGGEVFALRQFPHLAPAVSAVTILSSAALPDAAFVERYRSSGLYAPPPSLLTSLAYDATAMALQALEEADPAAAMRAMTYNGLNGVIRFQAGYWADAPIRRYRYDPDCLRRSGDLCLVRTDGS